MRRPLHWPALELPVFSSANDAYPFLGELADAFRRLAAGRGVLIEWTTGKTSSTWIPSDALVEAILIDAASRAGLPVWRLPDTAPLVPPATWPSRFIVDGLRPADARTDVGPDLGPGDLSPTGDSEWRAVQVRWVALGDGRIAATRREWLAAPKASFRSILARSVAARTERLPPGTRVDVERPNAGRRRYWAEGQRFRGGSVESFLTAEAAVETIVPPVALPSSAALARHLAIVGSTGSGKTQAIATLAARAAGDGAGVLAVDLHGDLAPAIVARLQERDRSRLTVVDAGAPSGPRPGIVLVDDGPADAVERARTAVVAALRRLASEGGERFWGVRLERLFDSFIRLVPPGGAVLDELYGLLTDARRRDAARLTVEDPVLAMFLDELPGLLKRNPEFLWSAAARLSKVVLAASLGDLFRPGEEGISLGRELEGQRIVLLRIPMGELGPEGSAMAASLVVAAAYLALARPSASRPESLRALFAIDEAHLLSPALLAEIVSEGRKFGVGAILATQFPDRFEPPLAHAVAGAIGHHLVFRLAPAAARSAAKWLGIPEGAAVQRLPTLPVGTGLLAIGGVPGARRVEVGAPPPARVVAEAWTAAVGRPSDATPPTTAPDGSLEEAILFALLGSHARREPGLSTPAIVREVDGVGFAREPEAIAESIRTLARRGYLSGDPTRWAIRPAGARALGVGGATGAVSETALHRRLLVEAFWIFAAKGERLEIVRQGPFARLPDARLSLLPFAARGASPHALKELLDRRSGTWGYRFFGGRDVHVEAEVSGVQRPDRLRRGLAKARAARAHALFVVARPSDARIVRRTLGRDGRRPSDWSVWTLGQRLEAGRGPGAL